MALLTQRSVGSSDITKCLQTCGQAASATANATQASRGPSVCSHNPIRFYRFRFCVSIAPLFTSRGEPRRASIVRLASPRGDTGLPVAPGPPAADSPAGSRTGGAPCGSIGPPARPPLPGSGGGGANRGESVASLVSAPPRPAARFAACSSCRSRRGESRRASIVLRASPRGDVGLPAPPRSPRGEPRCSSTGVERGASWRGEPRRLSTVPLDSPRGGSRRRSAMLRASPWGGSRRCSFVALPSAPGPSVRIRMVPGGGTLSSIS